MTDAHLESMAIQGVRCILEALGEDPERQGLKDTPRRVLNALKELTWATEENESNYLNSLRKEFELEKAVDQMIVVNKIPFTSLCEHHMLPFIGHATVGYIPNKEEGRIVGISKPARIVQFYAARLQVQERMTDQIADAITYITRSEDVAVYLTAEHFCMALRGPKVDGTNTVTSSMNGKFRVVPEARAEFLALARETHS